METVKLADAKAHLSELVEKAASGESIVITRRGKPVAQITAVQKPRRRIDVSMLRAVTDKMRPQKESAGEFVRKMRDEARY